MFTIEIDGLDVLQQQFRQLAIQAHQALVQALNAEAERILDQSIPLVPVDTGLLVSTGMVEKQPFGADIRYGGHGIADYAALVEFDTTMNHPNGGQAHFLSEPLFAATGDMPVRLAADVAAALRR
jgi:hypothetical protein